MSNFASDYIDVATRIAQIKGDADRHFPDGSFQPADRSRPFEIVTIEDTTYIAYVAAFYRNPDDTCPGIGSAWEQVPGRTQFTRGSELQNAETSAWGRALIASLAADTKKGIASADEVRNRQDERDNPLPRAPRRPNATTRQNAEQLGDPATRPDEFAVDPVTDNRWLEDFRARLVRCGKPSEVRGLDTEAHVQFGEGKLTADDARQLKVEIDTRLQELTGELVSP